MLDGNLHRLADTFANLSLADPNSFFFYQTGFSQASLTLGSSGLHTLAFGVVNLHDTLGASAVFVDNIGVSAIPEPASLVLLLAGLAGVVMLAGARMHREV
jgi:hypothetical protein